MNKDYRRCVSCRKIALKSEFWRVVKCHPSNQIAIVGGAFGHEQPDHLLQGRSAYLCPTAACLQVAQKKNRLGRSLKAPIREDIYQQLLGAFAMATGYSQRESVSRWRNSQDASAEADASRTAIVYHRL